jgi:hypothetical protein
MDIIEGQNLIGFINPGTRDFTTHDPAENTVIHPMPPLKNIRYRFALSMAACKFSPPV